MIVDSNIFIYSLLPQYEALQQFLLSDVDQFQASAITKLEVAGFHKLVAGEKQYFDDLFSIIHVFPIDEKTIAKAIELRQQRKRSLADSIIAATALIHAMPVLTNNVADFADIDGLQVIQLTDVLNA
ncbi:type II toxin-antitoxin system VapC family toxin [Spirosoma rhododendri]|uniref:Type II toxin-antitoxin system VapC family toxin n=1 Tax=Spirosoma rhododendri TaxID=2728024 RepID=A0A7L5DPD9_9BACT|nr:type II toxin-antitoxin system VapC family toxin [Spirosoma rhododendri]QJD79341.1 type II toxin-antitoxin system VapC family toxin [Spirosoma rhododendri]